MSELRQRFIETLNIAPENVIFPENPVVAFCRSCHGAAFYSEEAETTSLKELLHRLTTARRRALVSSDTLNHYLLMKLIWLADFRMRRRASTSTREKLNRYHEGVAFLE